MWKQADQPSKLVTHRRAPEDKRERRWAWWPAFLNRPFFAYSSRTIFLVLIIPVSIVFYAVTFSTPSMSKFRVIRQDKPALSNSATISDIPFHSTRSHYSFHIAISRGPCTNPLHRNFSHDGRGRIGAWGYLMI